MEANQITDLIEWVIAIVVLTVISTLCYITYNYYINSSERILVYMAKANKTYCDQMIEYKTKGYDFIVDGTRLVEVSDEFITSSFGKYNIVCDAGNQVIMTTLQPQLEDRSYTTMPIFFWWL